MEQDRLFVSDAEVKWMCLNCGQVMDATWPPPSARVQASQGFFIRLEMAPFQ